MTLILARVREDLLPMLLQLREDDQGGGPLFNGPLGAPHLNKGLVGRASHLKGLLRVQDQGVGYPDFGYYGYTCKGPVSTVLSGLDFSIIPPQCF